MVEIEKNRLLIKSVLKACKILNIDENRLFSSLALETVVDAKSTDNIKLKKEDIELLVTFIHIYRFIDGFCGGDIEFIHHWVTTKNKCFDAIPRESFYTRNGIQRLHEYVQRFNHLYK
jgi:hypothetical protein